jgi:hypothetical protein
MRPIAQWLEQRQLEPLRASHCEREIDRPLSDAARARAALLEQLIEQLATWRCWRVIGEKACTSRTHLVCGSAWQEAKLAATAESTERRPKVRSKSEKRLKVRNSQL